jgi:hypothetical protein
MTKTHPNRTALKTRILILIPLPIIAAIVLIAGQNPRTGLFEADLQAEPGGAGRTAPLTVPLSLSGTGFNLVDTIQSYQADNLYMKINGHDAAILRFGFVNLTCASYSRDGTIFVDLYAYRMDRRENALGVYANERSTERVDVELIDAGYRSGGGLFFYRGNWYLQLVPSENTQAATAAVDELRDSLLALLPAPPQPLPQLRWFAVDDLIPNSQGYFPDKALGAEFLNDVYTARIGNPDAPMTAFRHSSTAASSLVSQYRDFLREAAQPLPDLTISGSVISRFAAYGEETWLVATGDHLIGLSGVTESAHAATVLADLITVAETVTPEEPQP